MKDRNEIKIECYDDGKTTFGLNFVYSNGKEVLVGQKKGKLRQINLWNVKYIEVTAKLGER